MRDRGIDKVCTQLLSTMIYTVSIISLKMFLVNEGDCQQILILTDKLKTSHHIDVRKWFGLSLQRHQMQNSLG